MNYILNVSYWSDAMTGQSSYLNTCTRCLSLGVSRCMKDKKKIPYIVQYPSFSKKTIFFCFL